MPCPDEGYCETKTGYCCKTEDAVATTPSSVIGRPPPVPVRTRPWRGQTCVVQEGCDGGAACICDNGNRCRCECPTELGYTIAADGKSCQRVRRRLKVVETGRQSSRFSSNSDELCHVLMKGIANARLEKCKTDMECSSAFSECSTGGCRCKKGFQRDGRGGCKPISKFFVNSKYSR
ncbi:hypothetical protein OSTOST_05987 [Ostertagia ostertagi]